MQLECNTMVERLRKCCNKTVNKNHLVSRNTVIQVFIRLHVNHAFVPAPYHIFGLLTIIHNIPYIKGIYPKTITLFSVKFNLLKVNNKLSNKLLQKSQEFYNRCHTRQIITVITIFLKTAKILKIPHFSM